ncbi:MAG: hypothetical protein JJU11_07630 [Candidatus Sumerlaeia bacterium]|nr:hypothetical protein [Candidatus Sumerlaeia bacterium]
MTASPKSHLVAAFYKFARMDDVAGRVAALDSFCRQRELLGTILVASEGINATVSGDDSAVKALIDYLEGDDTIGTLDVKYSRTAEAPFKRMKVRERREIITLGDSAGDPVDLTGEHLSAREWNELLEREEVILLDTRNRYETSTGIFEGAVDPGLDKFSEFPDWVRRNLSGCEDRPVAMYCTGGIRCEKASAWMLRNGFKRVYQLDGGILRYIEETPPEESKWQGECFVFDERITVDERLERGSYTGFGPDGKSLVRSGENDADQSTDT